MKWRAQNTSTVEASTYGSVALNSFLSAPNDCSFEKNHEIPSVLLVREEKQKIYSVSKAALLQSLQ